MKRLFPVFLLLILLQSCYIARPCKIKGCHVEMEHKHNERTFSPRQKFWKTNIHWIWGKKIGGESNKKKIKRQRKEIENREL